MMSIGKNEKVILGLTAMLYAMLYLYTAIPFGTVITFALAAILFFISVSENQKKEILGVEFFHGYLLAFVAFCFLSALWAWDRQRAISMGMSMLKTGIITVLLFEYYRHKSDVNGLIDALLWGGYLACGVIVLLYDPVKLIMILITGYRIDNTYLNANSTGLLASITVIVHMHLIMQEKKLQRRDWLLLFGVFLIAISGSKKALLFFVGGCFLLVAIRCIEVKMPWKKILLIMSGIMVVMIGILMLPVFDHLRFRLESMITGLLGTGSESASTSLRIRYMRIGMEQFTKTPLLGIGMDSSWELVEKIVGVPAYLHCNFVELLACGGIVGFVIYYSVYGYVFYNLYKYRKYTDQNLALMLTLLILLFMMDLAMVSYYSKETYFYLIFLYMYVRNMKLKAGMVE